MNRLISFCFPFLFAFSAEALLSPNQCAQVFSPKALCISELLGSTPTKTQLRTTNLASDAAARTSSFLVRIVFLRAAAFVHGVAFLVALHQNKALIGDTGITPARHILNNAEERGRIKRERRLAWRKDSVSKGKPAGTEHAGLFPRFRPIHRLGEIIDSNAKLVKLREILWDRSDAMDRPLTTILWCAKDRRNLNPWLDRIALTGLMTSALIFLLGSANVPLILTLWVCQRSLMAVGGPWYGFGWEPQLAEVGFHSLFLVPLFSLNPLPSMPVPAAVSWSFRWLLFRIMLGAGLIKFRSGDRNWRDLTAMDYFYETQPVPNPLTKYFHWMPPVWHKGEVLVNDFVEVVAPWLLIIPGLPVSLRRAGGLIQIIFQFVLVSSGNLSFLNWLTMLPAIFCLDDALLGGLFSPSMRTAAASAAATSRVTPIRHVVSLAFLALILRLSVPVVKNLLSKRQVMNSSFDPLRLVSTYGAFGVVNEQREEFVVSSTTSWDSDWKEYEFKVKPGSVNRTPRFISPYHYRLDWQMWIAASIKNLSRNPWMFPFLTRLLEQDEGVLSLMASDPWRGSVQKPKYIRVDMYRYKFHKRRPGENNAPYWDREFLGRVYPRQGIASIETLKDETRRRYSS